MRKEDFVSLAPLTSKLTKRKKSRSGRNVDFRKASILRFEGGRKVDVHFKYSDLGTYSTISFQKGKGKPQKTAGTVFEPKYPNGRPIKAAKFRDINSLLKFIPPVYHDFYLNLKSDNMCEGGENNGHDSFDIDV